MMLINLVTVHRKLALGISVSFILLTWCLIASNARADNTDTRSNLQKEQEHLNVPNEGRVPGRVRGGGARGNCPEVTTDLTAIAPYQNVTVQGSFVTYVDGVTTAERPTFWFYVPYALTAELTAEFILQDAEEQEVYRVSSTELASAESTPGLISISLPVTVAPLEIDKTYYWFFKVACESESPIFVEGGIERIALDATLAQQLASASSQEQVELYQSNGIWYDAIALLGSLHQAQPNNSAIATEWNRLLQTLGLEDTPAPIR